MLLAHPWLRTLAQPETIAEEAEDTEDLEAAAQKLSLGSGPIGADDEVAQWVKSALDRKRRGDAQSPNKPALHAAPFDATSPMAAPKDGPLTGA